MIRNREEIAVGHTEAAPLHPSVLLAKDEAC